MEHQFAERDNLVLRWQEAQKALAVAKETEMQLRKQIVALNDTFGYTEDDREGTQNVELGNGYKLKATFKLSRSLDQKKVQDVLDSIESDGPEGALIAERLVKWNASLQKKEYDMLPTKYRRKFDKILTIKPSTPSLTLVEPKGK